MRNNPIEHGIRPICDVLNAHPQITTRWSCEGHYTHSRPYVSFEAPTEVVRKMHLHLMSAQEQGHLKYHWTLNASFQDKSKNLQWLLAMESHVPRWRYLRFLRQQVDAELNRMRSILQTSINDSR